MRAIRIFLIGFVIIGLAASMYLMTRQHRDAGVARQYSRPDPWSVTSVDAKSRIPALLWTGELGIRIGRDGSGCDYQGNPLPSFVPWKYQVSGEEKILPIPNPLAIDWKVGGSSIRFDPTKSYRQTLDFRTSTLKTEYWVVRGNRRIRVVTATFISKPVRGQPPRVVSRWEITPMFGTEVELTPVGTNEHGTRYVSQFSSEDAKTVFRARMWWTLGNVELGGKAGLNVPVKVSAGETLRVSRHVTVFSAAQSSAPDTAPVGPANWTNAHSDIEIDGPIEDQQGIRAMLWYLRSGYSHANGSLRPSPFLTSSDKYFGHVFWDADVWVGPAMAFLEPHALKTILNYRLGLVNQAILNAGNPPGVALALRFPWESSVSGKETVPGPSRDEIHITGSVVWALNRASDLGYISPKIVASIGQKAALYYLYRSTVRPDGKREIKGVMSPDENHVGDNDLYTNVLAQWLCDRFLNRPEVKYYLPRDSQTFLTYDNDSLRGYKQTAALLTIFPLESPLTSSEASKMYDRFASKTTMRGPAMSDSIHSIIAARLGRVDEAYGLWRKAWVDFSQAPLLLYSEKRNLANAYFTTGAAGALQAVQYGFAGMHVMPRNDVKAAARLPLANGKWLCIYPRLPRAWKSMTLRNLTILGKRYDLLVGKTSASFTESETLSRRTSSAAAPQTAPAKK